MGTWRDGWFIFLKDLKAGRYYLIWNVIFMLYMGTTTSFIFSGEDSAKDILHPLADFMLLLLVPFTAFAFCRRSFRYLKDDSYTQMLFYYRMLPIPMKAVMKGRWIHMGFSLLFNSIFYYGTLLWLSSSFWGEIDLSAYFAFALTWIGYAVLMTSGYIYFEFLKRGRTYMWMTIIVNGLVAGLAFVVNLFDGNVILFVMKYSKEYGLLSPVMWGSLLIGILILGNMSRITIRKLGARDLA